MAGMSDCTRSFIRCEKLTARSTPSASPLAALREPLSAMLVWTLISAKSAHPHRSASVRPCFLGRPAMTTSKLSLRPRESGKRMAALLDRRGSAAARSSDRASRSGRPAELRPKGLSEHRIGVRHESPMRPRMDIALIDDAKAELLLDAQRCGVAGENAGRQKAMAFAEQAIDAVSYTHLTLPTILLV